MDSQGFVVWECLTPSSVSNPGDDGKKTAAVPGSLGPILRKDKCHSTSPLSTATSLHSSVAPYFSLLKESLF